MYSTHFSCVGLAPNATRIGRVPLRTGFFQFEVRFVWKNKRHLATSQMKSRSRGQIRSSQRSSRQLPPGQDCDHVVLNNRPKECVVCVCVCRLYMCSCSESSHSGCDAGEQLQKKKNCHVAAKMFTSFLSRITETDSKEKREMVLHDTLLR